MIRVAPDDAAVRARLVAATIASDMTFMFRVIFIMQTVETGDSDHGPLGRQAHFLRNGRLVRPDSYAEYLDNLSELPGVCRS